jgi:Fe-S cluster assembly protein SufB
VTDQEKILNDVTGSDYKFGFQTDIDTDTIPKGLSEEVIRIISAKKEEPEWLGKP